MKRNTLFHSVTIICSFVLLGLALNACVAARLPISLFSVTVKVVDETGAPVANAKVVSENNEVNSGTDGNATLKYNGVGMYVVSAVSPAGTTATTTVNVPSDKSVTIRLPKSQGVMTGGGAQGASPYAMMGQAFYPVMFQFMFSAYGYNIDTKNYEAGQWTSWTFNSKEDKDGFQLKKSFLTKTADGKEWWQVRFQDGTDTKSVGTFEVMFDAKRTSIRRMRQKWGADEPAEVPVTEGWYQSPYQLTPESMEGSVKQRNVSVKVPAGTFTADLLEFGVAPGTTLRVWRVASVPGGVVKYEMKSGDQTAFGSELQSSGANAKTELKSY